MKRLITTFIALAMFAFNVEAQIAGSVKLGLAGYQGDVHCRTDENIGALSRLSASFGLGARIPLAEAVGLRVEGTYFSLSADETEFSDKGHISRGWTFENKFLELAALVDWEILGNRRFDENGKFKRTLTPLVFGGVGLAFNNPEVNFAGSNHPEIPTDMDEGDGIQFAVPVGVGLKYYLTEKFALGLETGVRLPLHDYVDGVSLTANPDENDAYGWGGLKAYVGLGGKKDADGDGVSDKKDACPNVPGLAELDGCPDRDGDGITDKRDNCPDTAGPVDLKGCPDTDGDGIVDIEDQCPQVPGGAALKGCPDSDGDGVIDMEDQCPNTAGLRSMSGCPDSDGDGIVDANDECPNEAGTSLNNGCPEKDSDGDGIKDSADDCPEVAGIGAFKGCPDTDKDGVQDSRDKCPTTAGSPSNNGCPVIKEADRQVLQLAVQAVRFETARDALKTESYAILDQVVDIMNRYPDYNVRVRGYTDDRGNAAANQKLSENRARTCAKYLESKGISRSRISSQGYGETNPISTNDTPEGRRMNRRVEFDLNLR